MPTFFLNTLGVSNKVIVNLFHNSCIGDISTPPDMRDMHPPAHKLSEETEQLMRNHINHSSLSL